MRQAAGMWDMRIVRLGSEWGMIRAMPRFTLSTLMFCTLVLALATGLCMKLPVTDFQQVGTSLNLSKGPNGAISLTPIAVYEPIGTHPPTGTDLLLRLAWVWPTVIAITFGTVLIARKLRALPRRKFVRVAVIVLGALSVANFILGMIYTLDANPEAAWFQAVCVGVSVGLPILLIFSRLGRAKPRPFQPTDLPAPLNERLEGI